MRLVLVDNCLLPKCLPTCETEPEVQGDAHSTKKMDETWGMEVELLYIHDLSTGPLNELAVHETQEGG